MSVAVRIVGEFVTDQLVPDTLAQTARTDEEPVRNNQTSIGFTHLHRQPDTAHTTTGPSTRPMPGQTRNLPHPRSPMCWEVLD